jgi:hypothetical protein
VKHIKEGTKKDSRALENRSHGLQEGTLLPTPGVTEENHKNLSEFVLWPRNLLFDTKC